MTVRDGRNRTETGASLPHLGRFRDRPGVLAEGEREPLRSWVRVGGRDVTS
jgi:hypothetical protein